MEKLLNGIVKFMKKDFEDHKELFKELGKDHSPHTLFIGCSDSRVVPNLITNTLPGELFVVRNIANIVPPYRETSEYVATTSAIEYAVQVLNVENIVVCGHSNCGGCSVLHNQEKIADIPHVKKWLELTGNIKEMADSLVPDDDPGAREWITEQINIVEQLKHLMTYPFIKEKYVNGKIKIFGWYYIIETGEVFNYNKDNGYFELIGLEK